MEPMQPKRNFFQRILYNRLRKCNRCYPYPVLYSDGTISNAKCDRIGRKPLGVFFENHLITLRDSSKKMNWYDAMGYCKNIKVFEQSCDAGALEFWKKLVCEKGSRAVNKVLASLGGKRIKPERPWSSTERSSGRAWLFRTRDGDIYGDGYGGVIWDYKAGHYVVRPVLDFSEIPSEVAAGFVWLN